MATALLVIDLQVGVVAVCDGAEGVLARSWDLVTRARAAGVPVAWVQHEEDGMDRDSAPWQLAPPLVPAAGERRIFKQYNDAFAGTELREALGKARHLVVCGAQTDWCIRATTHRAMVDGFDVTLVADGHTTGTISYDGETVTAAQSVALLNRAVRWADYPGQTFAVLPAAEVSF